MQHNIQILHFTALMVAGMSLEKPQSQFLIKYVTTIIFPMSCVFNQKSLFQILQGKTHLEITINQK